MGQGRRRGGDRQRGAVLVETAVILPLIMVLTMGIIEYSRMFNAKSTADAAARAGGRVASTMTRNTDYASSAAAAAATAVDGLPDDVPQELLVYRANSNGRPQSGSFTSCTTDCIRYVWNESTDNFDYVSGSWPASSHNVCGSVTDANWPRVGIYVKIEMSFLTGLFGGPRTMGEWSVFRMEPVTSQQCT